MGQTTNRLMRVFSGKAKAPAQEKADPVGQILGQQRYGLSSPFDGYMNQYQPLKVVLQIYDIMREAIPLIDVALRKRARLTMGITLDGLGDKQVQKILDDVYSVNVGWMQRGINTFVQEIVMLALNKGYAIWEIVPEYNNRGINRLGIGKPEQFRIQPNEAGRPVIEQEVGIGSYAPLSRPDFVFAQTLSATEGGYYGRPIFASCPFIANIVIRILTALDAVIWRFGDPTMVTVLKGGEATNIKKMQEAVSQYGEHISRAMAARKIGKVYDVEVAVPKDGEFSVHLLGADSKPMEVDTNYKLAMEQIISAAEMPPWMYGLSWATTERLSTNQNEAATAVIEGDRTALEPTVERLVDTALIMAGKGGARWRMEWLPINLSDETGAARTRLMNAQAIEKELLAALAMRDAEMLDDEQLLQYVIGSGIVSEADLFGSPDSKVSAIRKMGEAARQRQTLTNAKIIAQGI
jgi:hypothetical protein